MIKTKQYHRFIKLTSFNFRHFLLNNGACIVSDITEHLMIMNSHKWYKWYIGTINIFNEPNYHKENLTIWLITELSVSKMANFRMAIFWNVGNRMLRLDTTYIMNDNNILHTLSFLAQRSMTIFMSLVSVLIIHINSCHHIFFVVLSITIKTPKSKHLRNCSSIYQLIIPRLMFLYIMFLDIKHKLIMWQWKLS